MQNWKIKRMSIGLINGWLEAINALLDDYLNEKPCRGCPLCQVDYDDECKKCIWLIIEREDCFKFAYRNGFIEGPKRHEMRWQVLRIPILRRWKKILQDELSRREE